MTIDNPRSDGHSKRMKTERRSDVQRVVFTMIMIIIAVAIQILIGVLPVSACQNGCTVFGTSPSLAAFQSDLRAYETIPYRGRSTSKPMRNPIGDCHCLPHHTGQVDCLMTLLTPGPGQPTASTETVRESTHDPHGFIISSQHPPNTHSEDIFLKNSVLLI
jgi:hypothetical protein